MKHRIEAQEPTVVLELSVKEFAGLLRLHQRHGGGKSEGLRGQIERGLYGALAALPEPWRAKVNGAADLATQPREMYAYNDVDTHWKEA